LVPDALVPFCTWLLLGYVREFLQKMPARALLDGVRARLLPAGTVLADGLLMELVCAAVFYGVSPTAGAVLASVPVVPVYRVSRGFVSELPAGAIRG